MRTTVRLARWSATHPWRAIALWVIFVGLCVTLGSMLGVKQASDSDTSIGEAGRADQIVRLGQFDDPVVENVLITARSGEFDSGQAQAAASAVSDRMRARADVKDVAEPVTSPNGHALLVQVSLRDAEPSRATIDALLAETAAVAQDFPALRVEEVGNTSINNALDDTIGKDFKKAELFSIPVTLIILLVAFGALIAAGIPVLLALSAVMAALGLTAAVSHLVPSTDTASSVTLLIGLAVGVDYSLFYLRREREERAKGAGHLAAVEVAAATSGRAVVVSGIAVILSMSGCFLANDSTFTSLAIGAILVVAVSVVGSLTVLPAILAKIGRWVDRPRIPFLWRVSTPKVNGQRSKFWSALLRPALRRPAATLVVAVLALLALAAPALHMRLSLADIDTLPRTTPVMQAYDRLIAAFPSTGTTHEVAVLAPPEQASAVRKALDDLLDRTRTDPLFASDSLAQPRVSADNRVTYIDIATPYATESAEAARSLDELRQTLVPQTVGKVPGAEVAVGGHNAMNKDYAALITGKLPYVVGMVLLLTFVVMALTFRSLVIALTAISLNLLSAAAAYGLVQLVFGGTWAEHILGFHSIHAVITWLPLFLFVVLFGLSMDYHVFVVSRIREGVQNGLSTRDAVEAGIISSAGVVTSAAAVMVAVFSIFATLSQIEMKQLGVGLAAAILLDATIIRVVVLPSLMILLGKMNWWPGRIRPAQFVGAPQPITQVPVAVGQR